MERQAYWIPRWIAVRSWQILKKPIYHILTGAQANYIRPWFAFFASGYLNERQCSLGISPFSGKINTFSDWHTINIFIIASTPIKWSPRALCFCFWYWWGCHQGTLSQKRQASLQWSSWYSLRIWPVCWLIQKALSGTQNGHNGSWSLFSIHYFLWSSFNDRH